MTFITLHKTSLLFNGIFLSPSHLDPQVESDVPVDRCIQAHSDSREPLPCVRAGGLTSRLGCKLPLSLCRSAAGANGRTNARGGGEQTVQSAEEMRRERRTMTSVTRALPRLLSDTGQKKSALERKDVRRISFQRPKGTMEYVVSSRCCLSEPGGFVYIMHRCVCLCAWLRMSVCTQSRMYVIMFGMEMCACTSGMIHSLCRAVSMCCRKDFNCSYSWYSSLPAVFLQLGSKVLWQENMYYT